MTIVHALGYGAVGCGLGVDFIAQPVADRGEREFRGAVIRRQTHRLAQFALAARKISQLVQDQAHQASDRRAVQPAGNRRSKHIARFFAGATLQQESGFAQAIGAG